MLIVMKKIFLTIVLALFGIAANAQPAGLVGTWKSSTMDILGDGEVLMSLDCADAGMDMGFVFKSNGTVVGTVTAEGDTETDEMSYKVDGTNILVTDETGETMSFKYVNGKLSLEFKEEGVDVRLNFKKL